MAQCLFSSYDKSAAVLPCDTSALSRHFAAAGCQKLPQNATSGHKFPLPTLRT